MMKFMITLKRELMFLIFQLILSSFFLQPVPQEDGRENPPIVDFNGLEPLLNKKNDTIYVVNFWATWCVPCVHELPYLEELTANYKDKKLKVLLVSLDFRSRLERQLYPFLEENNIQSEVIVLDDPKSNIWIDKVNPEWSGAIPATLAYNSDKRLFTEGNFASYADLEQFIQPLLKEKQ